MPVPTAASIKEFIKTAIVSKQAQGKFLKRDETGNVIEGITEGMEDIIDVMAEGVAAQWLAWQTVQPVGPLVVTGTSPSGPVTGTAIGVGPTGLP